jgi:eukaryotic-like serine/threonine-protein kinase
MSVAPSTKLGPYQVVEMLGAGGMGEVYRARDSRLKRDVALKVLPCDFASDSQRMARFEREAQLLASLNHPNIASIYGLEESGDVRAFVMELVEGPTLAEHITRGPIPPAEGLAIARQIAEALEYAHERGIIHRDLKPANIKVRPDDSVKVLDFGLAKALAADGTLTDTSTSPTLTAGATRAGIVLGTAAYMSPEQARARSVDRRTDIWAFGCVLFEMLSGEVAFRGETTTDTLAAVLTKEPDFEHLPASTPVTIRRLINRCLQKDIKKRLQSIGDARIDIDDCLAGRDSGEVSLLRADGAQGREAKGQVRRWQAFAAFAVFFLTISAGLIAWRLKPQSTRNQNWTADMIAGPSVSMGPRISPDGRTLAFQAMIENLTQVAVSSPDTGNWTLLTRDRQHGFVNEISWGPDGSKLYYDRTIGVPVGIYSISALGGAERLVLENAGSPEVLPDGSLLIIRKDSTARWQIVHFWPDSQRLEPLPGWVSIGTTIPLRVFPDGKEAVFNGMVSETDPLVHLYVMDIGTGKTRRLDPQLPDRRNNESYPIATSADNLGVLVDLAAGDLHRIVFVPRHGKGNIQTVMTLTKPPWYLESAKDGALYLDQVDRPHEILRFPAGGGQPEVLGSSDTYVPAGQYMEPVETTDGRFLLDTEFSGRGRLLVAKPGEDFVPLLDTNDETSSPATSLGKSEIAFVLGSGSAAMVVIASASEGRVVQWLLGTKGRHITALAASADSKTIYFGAAGYIWSIPADDGSPQKIAAGDNVSVNPNGHDLVITQSVTSNPTLTRVSTDSGKAEEVHLENVQSLAPVPTGARAISRQGKMLITISPSDSWFYRVAVLDLRSGKFTPIQVGYAGDTLSSNWTADGHVISVGLPLKSHIWRFRPDMK